MADVEGKKLTELRVIDLKTELERRGLDKAGNKAALLERLSKAITEEGENPDEYLIVPCGGPARSTPRKNSFVGCSSLDESSESTKLQKENSNEMQEVIETIPKAEESSSPLLEADTSATKSEELEDETQNSNDKSEMETETNIVKSVTLEEKLEEEPAKESTTSDLVSLEPENPVVNESQNEEFKPDENQTIASAETNGIDNEDSINLTIGEDEENLLVEETESHDRLKDRGVKKSVEDNKKGDSKGSGRDESSCIGKDGTSSGGNTGTKSKQDGGDGGGKSSDSNAKNQKKDDKGEKKIQINSANASSRNLWVSGLSSTTRATDLKQIFSKYGKVIGAKIVTNARTPGARCYGYVTMATSKDATKCTQHLHKTELHGRVISVEKAKGDSQEGHPRKRDAANDKLEKKEDKERFKDNHDNNDKKSKDVKKGEEPKEDFLKMFHLLPFMTQMYMKKKTPDDKSENIDTKKSENPEKKEDNAKESDSRSTKSNSKKSESDRGRRDERRMRSWDRHRSHSRSKSHERRRQNALLTFEKIRAERERQKIRERARLLREEQRRRRSELERQREVERRNREEAARLEREREKLKRERERIEQERLELLRLERERQKLEREKLERERLELKRQQMRLEESRRPPPPPSIKRTSSDRRDTRDLYVEPERKRIASDHSRRHSPDRVTDRRNDIMDRVSDRRMDPSPPSRYESSRSTQDVGIKKDFKRSSDFGSRSSRPETFSDVSRGREVIVRREPLSSSSSSIDPRQVKERYDRPSSTSYSRDREVRRSEPESHRSSRDGHTRYGDSFKPPGSSSQRDNRYMESNRNQSSWHSGPPSTKSFNSVPSGGTRDPRNDTTNWSSRSSDNVNRWSNSSSLSNTMRHPVPPSYQSNQIQSIGLNSPNTAPMYMRFDPYKSSIPSMRKY